MSTKKSASLVSKRGKFDRRLLLLILPAVILLGYVVSTTRAAAGSLYLTPANAVVANTATFTVQVRESSGTDPVNAVQANLTYDATKLDFVSISDTGSAFATAAEGTGGAGVVKIARGNVTAVTGDQLVATVTFRSKISSGTAAVDFSVGSALVRSTDNVDILVTKTGGTYGPDSAPPTAPTNLTTSNLTGTAATLSWSGSTDNVGVTGYRVYRNNVLRTTQTGLTYTDTGLTMSTTYSYTVSAIDAAGNESAKTAALSVTTKDTAAPSVPSISAISAPTSSTVSLSWSASTDTGGSGLKGYKVYRNGGATAIASPTSTSYTDQTVVGSTTYSYTVSAIDNANNESAKSAASSVTTPAPPDTTAPSVPASFRSTGTSLTSISLAWNASTDNVGVTGYRISEGTAVVANVAGLSYTHGNLTPGTSHSYTVQAYDAAGNVSAATAVLTVSTLPLKKGDVNGDNSVDIFDLSAFLATWNTTSSASDFNKDGTVDIFDLSILLTNWGA
ncbi:MAG: glycoside hydrolase family 48 [Candidatus Saccharibacteria bacterium]|nr:glycoside hydrolase family 48 [Candidatus Saccharibacteria bacterium]